MTCASLKFVFKDENIVSKKRIFPSVGKSFMTSSKWHLNKSIDISKNRLDILNQNRLMSSNMTSKLADVI